MPQRKQLTWAQLRVGALVIAGLVVLAVGIFFISGQVGFFTHRYSLKTYFSSASSLRQGAQVRLAGIAVGNVENIRISQYTEPSRAVEIDMRVARKYQDQIRTDSVATVETVGLLGESYVDISRGGPSQSPLTDGGVVQSHEEADIKQIVQNANDVVSNLRVLSSKLNDITGQIQHGQGSIGKLIYEESFYNSLDKTANEAQSLMTRIDKGQGTLGKLLNDETFYTRAVATIDKVNQVMDQVQHGDGSVAKLINDPSIYNNLNQAAQRANTLMANINEGKGTLGKLAKDPALYNRINETVGHVDVITSRIDHGQGTMGKLSTDPTLFNNLVTSSQSLKEFLNEFRTNPRKYMTMHLHIF
ncbi:MAG TPA: MlaD family protein [Terriglobia bacterium]|nr:MlaD family protein [Terriglobia bacterium]